MAAQSSIAAKGHRRFAGFAVAVRRQHTIGIRYGQVGIGKTLSARRYARCRKAENPRGQSGPRNDSDFQIHAAPARARTIFTPSVLTSPQQIHAALEAARSTLVIGIS